MATTLTALARAAKVVVVLEAMSHLIRLALAQLLAQRAPLLKASEALLKHKVGAKSLLGAALVSSLLALKFYPCVPEPSGSLSKHFPSGLSLGLPLDALAAC